MTQNISAIEKLSAYLDDRKISQRSFASEARSHQSIISRILAGDIRPSIDLAARIQAVTSGAVMAADWAQHTEGADQ